MFVVGTVLDALHVQCARDVQASLPANNDCSVAVNDTLMAKLAQNDAFKTLQQLGIFRRNFINAPNRKDVFRA
jgi:hypothetical protein